VDDAPSRVLSPRGVEVDQLADDFLAGLEVQADGEKALHLALILVEHAERLSEHAGLLFDLPGRVARVPDDHAVATASERDVQRIVADHPHGRRERPPAAGAILPRRHEHEAATRVLT